MRQTIAQLNRRNVVRVGVTYAVAAWLTMGGFLQEALEVNPDGATFLRYLAGDFDLAEDPENPDRMDELSWALVQSGEFAAARRLLERRFVLSNETVAIRFSVLQAVWLYYSRLATGDEASAAELLVAIERAVADQEAAGQKFSFELGGQAHY